MGFCSSSQTSETRIPPPSPEEEGLLNLAIDGVMMSYLDEAGYDVTKNETSWADSDQAKNFIERKANLDSRISSAKGVLNTTSPNSQRGIEAQNTLAKLLNEQKALIDQENKAKTAFKPTITYDTRKKDDLATEQIRAQYGEDSPQYQEAKTKYEQGLVDAENKAKQIEILTMDSAEKFLRGDYSLSPEQDKFVSDVLGPVRDAGLKAVEYLKEEAGLSEGKLNAAADGVRSEYLATDKALRADIGAYKSEVLATGESLSKALEDFKSQIKQTGMTMGDAILELENRINTTGGNMKQALEESINFSKSLTEMGIQDFSLQTRNAIAAQAAALGRSATDPEFIQEMSTAVNKEIARSGLNFGLMSAQGRLGVEERTGAGLENAALLRLQAAQQTGAGLEEAARMGLGIAERTGAGLESAAQMGLSASERLGAGLEGVAGTRFGIAERTAGLNEQAALMRGQVDVGSAEAGANLRTQIGMGQVPGVIGTGFDVAGYQQSLESMRLNNAMNAASLPNKYINYYQQGRLAQPTTRQTSTPSAGGIIGGIIGTGMSAYATAMGVPSFGGGGGGGGGGSFGSFGSFGSGLNRPNLFSS